VKSAVDLSGSEEMKNLAFFQKVAPFLIRSFFRRQLHVSVKKDK